MKINNQNYGIEVKNLSFSYENDGGYSGMALQNVNFTADFGECVGIIGANGAGKSTFLKILVGLLGGYTGDVNIGGLEINKKNLSDIRCIEGYVFQDSDSQLFMSTVYEDVAFAPVNYGLSEEETKQRVTDALKMMGIEELCDRHTFRLSGGQKKLAAIATILSMTPEIILLDEPPIVQASATLTSAPIWIVVFLLTCPASPYFCSDPKTRAQAPILPFRSRSSPMRFCKLLSS